VALPNGATPIRLQGPARPTRTVVAPPKHVIAESTYRSRRVVCVCGWQGSSAMSADGRPSEWTAHVAANRGKAP